jgi:hypothetical protein
MHLGFVSAFLPELALDDVFALARDAGVGELVQQRRRLVLQPRQVE